MKALHAIQAALGAVPAEADAIIADIFNLSRAEIRGIVSFYSDFSRDKKAETVVRICAAEACQAMGARSLLLDLENSTEASTHVAVEKVYCLGLCSAAPAAMIGDKLIGRADAQQINTHVQTTQCI
jgi:formate dehydrogenase subunit gamma